MSPQAHAVDSRHDNNSSKEKIQSSLHQPNDAEARTSSQSAEEQHRSGEEPISGPAVVPLADDAESRGRPGEDARWGRRSRPSRLLVQQRESRRPREETRTRNWEKTHFYGFGGNEAEGGKEGGESFNMSHFGSGWRTCVKSLVGLFRQNGRASDVLKPFFVREY